jgi:hypothetical protein
MQAVRSGIKATVNSALLVEMRLQLCIAGYLRHKAALAQLV